MTDNEIIKAFEYCPQANACAHAECPLFGSALTVAECAAELNGKVLDIIQRQQERIERLKDNLDAVLAEKATLDVDRVVERLERIAYETVDWMCGGTMKAVELADAIEIVQGVMNDD